jgi:hypothetical protein
MAPSLTFHFTRNANTSNDDTIIIRKGEDDTSLSVSMYDAITGKKYTTAILKVSLHAYVNSLLTLAKYDSDPFQKVQVSAPYYPCFIFDTSDLMNTNVRASIDSLLEMCLATWFTYEEEEEDVPKNNCQCSYQY